MHNKLRKVLDEDSYNGSGLAFRCYNRYYRESKIWKANAGHRDEPSPQYDLDLVTQDVETGELLCHTEPSTLAPLVRNTIRLSDTT